MDEPFSALDKKNTLIVLSKLKKIKKNMIIILSNHDDSLDLHFDRIIYLD